MSDAVLFAVIYTGLVGVVFAGWAYQYGWNRGRDDERKLSEKKRRTFDLTLYHREPFGDCYTSVTAQIPTPVTAGAWHEMLRRVQARVQAQRLPRVISVVELDEE